LLSTPISDETVNVHDQIPRALEKCIVRRAAKGVNERLHVVITRQVSLDRVYEGRDAQRVACIGYGTGGTSSFTSKRTKKILFSLAARTDGHFLSLWSPREKKLVFELRENRSRAEREILWSLLKSADWHR